MIKINLLEGYLKGRARDPKYHTLYENLRGWRSPRPGKAHTTKEQQRAERERLKAEVYAAYGNECAGCGLTEKACLTIDHIHDNGAEERKRIGTDIIRWLRRHGFPKDDYQILCHNCQWRKRTYGPCFSSWPR